MQQGSTQHTVDKPLDRLQSMVNGVLVEIGKILHTANLKGRDALAHGNPRLHMTIPPIIDNFHFALDQIERDIIRARAVTNRDLQNIRAAKLASHQSGQNEIVEDKPVSIVMNGQDVHKDSGADTDMADITMPISTSDAKPETAAPESGMQAPSDAGHASSNVTIKDEKEENERLNPAPIVSSTPDVIVPASPSNAESTTTIPASTLPDNTSTSQPVSTMDLDLDSMFGIDSSLSTGNANLTTEAQSSGDQDLNFGINYDGTEDLDLSGFGEVDNTNEDVTAMLESLGGFTNTADDETQNTTGDNANNPNAIADSSLGLGDNDMSQLDFAMDGADGGMDPFDLNFDFAGGIDDGTDGLDNMEHGEFDDMFFGVGN